MSTTLQTVYVGKELAMGGHIVNIYGSYANALAHSSTGLNTRAFNIDRLTGLASGDAVSQVAKVTGFEIDQDGFIQVLIDDRDAAVYLMSNGSFGPPRRIANA